MCQWSVLHHHHIPPCPRPLTSASHYLYCPDAVIDPSTGEPAAPCTNVVFTPVAAAEGTATTTTTATATTANTAAITIAAAGWAWHGEAAAEPPSCCSLGKCLISVECSTGACRVEDLGGRWACCACGRGGNAYTTCTNRKVGSPDTFCYHNVCAACTADR
ncbi:hypothetical protein JDV02_004107 [Purpureocillium takamizusanense]|uniref:Uncharacterized protein n=1 Tax=Purpureocillium takamizusanense TaxID=2060973 RepID=A0A9Q8QE28_9HYPO|nr:uncharacterized protein JDV02_004107 [Purpureocillium takamizusanense]UNI17788.1 hypothetical protein JDV02_004107 [Purpureocillium takamizusanense]